MTQIFTVGFSYFSWPRNASFRMLALMLAWMFLLLQSPCTAEDSSSHKAVLPAPDPYLILQEHLEAMGGLEKLKAITSSYSAGKMRFDGLQGTFRHWERRPLQYRTEQDLGAINETVGDSGQENWNLDTNGQLLISRDKETLQRRELTVLMDNYEYLKPASPYFRVTYGGEATVAEQPCQKIIISNTINHDRYHFFFASANYHMLRSEIYQPDMTIISEYGDFRVIDGMLLSFYSHTTYLPWEKIEENWTEEYRANPTIDDTIFLPPAPRRDVRFPEGHHEVSVPFRLVENLMYLAVEMENSSGQVDKSLWIVDSGASMSVIDADYAEHLGLSVEGAITGYGFGELFELGFVQTNPFSVGELIFQGQKVYASRGLHKNSYQPEIQGILGYDFLSRFVVEIDYDTQRITLHDPPAFVYKGQGKRLAAPLKYRTFTLPITLDDFPEERWTVDLGAFHSSIHYPWAEGHMLLEKPGIETISQGLSSIYKEKTVEFERLAIGPFQLSHHTVKIPVEQGKGASALGEVAGNLGNSTLRHFHLFLDYPRQEIILEPGAHYGEQEARDKSGMVIGRSETNHPMVSFVAPGTPAEQAGFVAGDLLTEIGSRQIKAGDSIVELRQILRGKIGTKIPLRVDREGKSLTLQLTLSDLYPSQQMGQSQSKSN